MEFLWSNPDDLQSQVLWSLLILLPDPLMYRLELLLPWDNFCGIVIFQFVDCPPKGMGLDFMLLHPFSHHVVAYSLSLDTGYLPFGSFQCFFVGSCLAISWYLGIFFKTWALILLPHYLVSFHLSVLIIVVYILVWAFHIQEFKIIHNPTTNG